MRGSRFKNSQQTGETLKPTATFLARLRTIPCWVAQQMLPQGIVQKEDLQQNPG